MKKYILLFIISFSIIGVSSAQKKIGHVLRKYKNDDNVMNVNLNGDLTKMLNGSDIEIESKIELLDVLVFSKGTDVSDKHKDAIKNAIKSQGFEILINVKDKEGRLKLYVKENEDYIEEIYAQVYAQELNIHLILAGKIQYSDLSKLQLGFQGSDFFSKAVEGKNEEKDEK